MSEEAEAGALPAEPAAPAAEAVEAAQQAQATAASEGSDMPSAEGATDGAAEAQAAAEQTEGVAGAAESAADDVGETAAAEAEAVSAAAAADEVPAETKTSADAPKAEAAPAQDEPAEAAAEDVPPAEAASASAEAPAVPAATEAPAAPAPTTPTAAAAPAPMSSGPPMPLSHGFGFDVRRLNNVAYLTERVVVHSAANTVQLLDLANMQTTYLPGLEGGGIGCVAVHPSRERFAVCEKGRNPAVYVYAYPSLEVEAVLRGGAERLFTCAAFDAEGDRLATVAGAPDYWLTLWDWRAEETVLRSKAFAQDVYSVSFSPFLEGTLTTSGTGHVRFWRVASTFTGLKLQGAIGKFGNTELSDVCGFTELPDGKVLAGVESGRILVWDGGLIKVEVTRTGGKPCHEGNVDWMELDEERGVVYTAGADGVIRTWDMALLDAADSTDEMDHFELEPLAEADLSGALGRGVHVRAVARSPAELTGGEREWLVQDANGALVRVTWPEGGPPRKAPEGEEQPPIVAPEVKSLARFHAGALAALAASPASHHCATVGVDGALRLYDYRAQRVLYSRQFAGEGGASTLLWLPAGADASARTVVSGFADGVVRTAVRCADGWKLACAVKPHTKAVRALALSPDCATLATAGADGTIFFLKLSGKPAVLTPLGFMSTPSAPTALAWSADSARLLVGCAQGDILEVPAPQAESVDAEHTYELSLPAEFFDFKRPKPAAAAPAAGDKAEGEEGDKAEKDKAEGEAAPEGDKAEGDDEMAATAAEAEAEAAAAAAAGAEEEAIAEVTMLAYAGDGCEFDATFGGPLAGEVFRCDLESGDVVSVSPLLPPSASVGLNAGELSFFGKSSSGNLLLAGSADGRVHVRPTGATGAVPFEAALHDGEHGRVVGVAASFDDMTLLTGGGDGVLYVRDLSRAFVEELGGAARSHRDGDVSAVPTVKLEPFMDALDVDDPKAYSIEEAKQKTEEDNTLASAERKKAHVREYVAQLRERFVALKRENEAMGDLGLPADEMEVDPGLRAMIEAETDAKLERARAELAWESEKKRLALEKLRSWFLADVEVERVVLHAFQSGRKIASIRTAKLSPALEKQIAEVHEIVAREERAALEGGGSPGGSPGARASRDSMPGSIPRRSSTMVSAAVAALAEQAEGLSKQDMRRLQRKRREEEWRAFNETRPDESYENPDDVAAIEHARAHMGDFKLKSDPDYIVPEEQRVNAEKKRRQMVLLAESIYALKMGFNSKFFALRDVKARLAADVKRDNTRVREIDAELSENTELFEPVERPEEYPERRDEVTEQDLEEFKALKAAKAAKAAAAGGGFGGGGGGAAPKPSKAAEDKKAAEEGKAAAVLVAKSAVAETDVSQLSDLECAEREENCERLKYEKEQLLDKARSNVDAFDSALAELRRERMNLEVDLRGAEMKMLVLHRELDLLQEFEIRDTALKERYEAKAQEKHDVVDKIIECQERLEAKADEVDTLIERKKAIMADFDRAVEEGSTFREPLQKIFLRKIKRVKKRAKDDDEDYDSDEESEDDDDNEDFDEDEEEEVCPPGCDQALYEKVCDLRERRLDQEEIITEFQRAMDQLKKDKDALTKKQKNIETGLKALDGEMTAFQKEKQGKLNEIDVVVTLRAHQVEYLVEERLPEDLGQALVFSGGALSRLRSRIKELVQEKAALRRQQKELRREHVNLSREKGVKETRIAELQSRAYDVQMLKFGQLIDLDVLDRMGANKNAEDMKANLRHQEEAHAFELRQWESRIEQANLELSRMTAENTDCLTRVATLTRRQKDLETQLVSAQVTLFTDSAGARRKEIRERDRLVQLVNAQAKSIDGLKGEIQMLRRKGGHVFAQP